MLVADGASGRELLEEKITAALSAGDRQAAVTLLLQGYGPEVLRFLAALHRDEDESAEVFSKFAEAVWSAASTFQGLSSVRTWAYAIARRTSLRHRRDTRRRAAHFRPFPESSALADVEARVRSETLSFLRTERRSKLAALREALPPEDQMLLMLRVDRKLAWNDLAVVLAAEGAAAFEGEALKREAARLRKRFQALKERLREAGRREGLIDRDPGDP